MLNHDSPEFRPEEAAEMRAAFEPLAHSVRQLIDAVIRTEVDYTVVAAARAEIDSITARLQTKQCDTAFGAPRVSDGQRLAWGNAANGVRNAIAPPVVVNRTEQEVLWAAIELGAAYEGPPGHVHGGICALILDHLLADAASSPERPRLTGTISLRYVRATRLGRVRAEASVLRHEGVKTFVVGHLADGEGITVQAEGLFIAPRWARD